MGDALEAMSLRDKLNEADRLARELIHHLEHGFIPKAHVLRRTARQGSDPAEQGDVTDLTIRSTVDTVLTSDTFTRQVTDQLNRVLSSIHEETGRVLNSD